MTDINISNSVAKYEQYINNVLKEDLRMLQTRLDKINRELEDLIQQKHSLDIITNKSINPEGFKTQVNIGCNFFMEAEVKDVSKMIFHIGLNHFLEFSVEESNKHLDLRIKAYEQKSDELIQKAAQTKAHIKLMLFGISALQDQNSKDKLIDIDKK